MSTTITTSKPDTVMGYWPANMKAVQSDKEQYGYSYISSNASNLL